MNRTRVAGLALAFSTFAAAASATPVTLDFDELATGLVIGSTYAASGVIFEDAMSTSNLALAGGSGSVGVYHSTDNYVTDPADPIVAYFDFDVSTVSITGIDIGTRGFQISAYDALSGGSLIDYEEVIGPDVGVGAFYTLTVEATGIRRVEFSQANTAFGGDGALFDTFVFEAGSASTVPVPAALPLLAAALAGLGVFGARRATA